MDFLKALPPNSTKGALGKLTPRQAVEFARSNHLPGLAHGTVATYMNNLTAILRWAENDDWGVKPNTQGLTESRHPKTKRRGFTPKELNVLFKGLAAFRDDQPTKFWVPAVALFTGARANEICQLSVEDVIDVDGVWCLNLTVFDAKGVRVPGKRLKTPSSERMLPLHSALIEAGFIEFVERQANQGRLFSDLSAGPNESYSHGFSKWFGRFKIATGFTDPALVFHSFRHGFADACRDADIGDDTRRALGGWAAINEATKYGNRGAVANLHRDIKKISFGDFTLPRGAERI